MSYNVRHSHHCGHLFFFFFLIVILVLLVCSVSFGPQWTPFGQTTPGSQASGLSQGKSLIREPVSAVHEAEMLGKIMFCLQYLWFFNRRMFRNFLFTSLTPTLSSKSLPVLLPEELEGFVYETVSFVIRTKRSPDAPSVAVPR